MRRNESPTQLKSMAAAIGLSLVIAQPVLAFAPAVPKSQNPPADAIDQEASRLVIRSARFLEQKASFSVSWSASTDEVVEQQEKITNFQSGTGLIVRGSGFAAQTDRGTSRRDYYFDGSNFTVVSTDQGFFASAPFAGSFDDLVAAVRNRTGSILPVWVLFSDGLSQMLSSQMKAAAYLGKIRLDGVEVDHVAFSSGDEDTQVWLAADEAAPVPVKIITTRSNEVGWPQTTVSLRDWNFSPAISASTFRPVLPDDLTRVALPTLSPSEASDDK